MPFKCFSCGLSFDTAEEFSKHGLAHKNQLENPEGKGLFCLKCGEPFSIDSSEADYTCSVVCPSCSHILDIVVRKGKAELVITKESTEQLREKLLEQYRKYVLKYIEAKDMIESLVPFPVNLLKGEQMPTITITQDLMAKFHYAETTMTDALKKRQEIHEKLHRLQHN